MKLDSDYNKNATDGSFAVGEVAKVAEGRLSAQLEQIRLSHLSVCLSVRDASSPCNSMQ